jgi:hypothetical protein
MIKKDLERILSELNSYYRIHDSININIWELRKVVDHYELWYGGNEGAYDIITDNHNFHHHIIVEPNGNNQLVYNSPLGILLGLEKAATLCGIQMIPV